MLAKIFSIKRVTWTFLSEHAQVLDYDGRRLLLGISTIGLANTFRKGQHAELVRQALIEVLGVDAVVEGIPTPDSAAPAASPARSAGDSEPSAPAPPDAGRGRSAGAGSPRDRHDATDLPDRPDRAVQTDRVGLRAMAAVAPAPDDLGPEPEDDWNTPSAPPPDWATETGPPADPPPSRRGTGSTVGAAPDLETAAAAAAAPGGPARQGAAAQPADAPTGSPAGSTDPQEQGAITPMQRARQAVAREAGVRRTASPVVADDSSVSADDENIEDAGAMGVPVIERVLGGTVMGELDA